MNTAVILLFLLISGHQKIYGRQQIFQVDAGWLCRIGNPTGVQLPDMGRAAEVPARWIKVWSHCFSSFPAIKKFMAGKKYFRLRSGDCAGSEIILGLIFWPWSGRWSTCKMNTAMILLFLPISAHQKIYGTQQIFQVDAGWLCRIGNNTGVDRPAMGRAAEVPARWIQVWSLSNPFLSFFPLFVLDKQERLDNK